MQIERPMNIQLFADENVDTANSQEAQTQNGKSEQSKTETEKMVSKDLFDKATSEIAELKKQMKEMQKNGKSEAELKEIDLKEKDELLAKRNKELNDLYVKLNYANAIANVAEIKAKIKLDNDANMETVLNAIVTNNGDETSVRSKALSALMTSIYEKGVADAKSQEWSEMSAGIKSGGDVKSNNKVNAYIKNISKNNNVDTSNIKDIFK